VLSLKCLDLFLHSTISLHGVLCHCTCAAVYQFVSIIHSLWKTFHAIWQLHWKLCSCVLMDTAAISWRFVTWHFKAYFSSVRRVGNHRAS
jgi:hypothetical protein